MAFFSAKKSGFSTKMAFSAWKMTFFIVFLDKKDVFSLKNGVVLSFSSMLRPRSKKFGPGSKLFGPGVQTFGLQTQVQKVWTWVQTFWTWVQTFGPFRSAQKVWTPGPNFWSGSKLFWTPDSQGEINQDFWSFPVVKSIQSGFWVISGHQINSIRIFCQIFKYSVLLAPQTVVSESICKLVLTILRCHLKWQFLNHGTVYKTFL